MSQRELHPLLKFTVPDVEGSLETLEAPLAEEEEAACRGTAGAAVGFAQPAMPPVQRRRLGAGLLGAGLAAAALAAFQVQASHGRLRTRESVGLSVVTERGCHNALHGDRCHTDVVWAMRHRQVHPEWYIGLDNCSTFDDFQAFMHKQVLNSGERRCPKPCKAASSHVKSAVGAGCKALLKTKEEEKNCHTAVPGDNCYAHVLYTKQEAVRYPKWYPGLSEESSLKEVQHYLQQENVCPEPCGMVKEPNAANNITGCHTALPGETCFADIILAKDHFILKNPEWYPGLTNASSHDEFQAFLHNQRHVDSEAAKKACPNPCNKEVVDEAKLRATCKTAEMHDECYESVLWGATKGIKAHPDWYAGLYSNSSFEDFQLHLHKDNNTKCHFVPCPCHVATKGDKCYNSVMWVLTTGIEKHRMSFKGLSATSTFLEAQAYLHGTRTSPCGRPCKTFPGDSRAPWRYEA
mmetsp:Transcript_120404/g.335941  ORF Transcript_120404/g.335941 Transcript_120404/m.335941 type:complete len:464 (-) Transcript_120404:128-1519(-)